MQEILKVLSPELLERFCTCVAGRQEGELLDETDLAGSVRPLGGPQDGCRAATEDRSQAAPTAA